MTSHFMVWNARGVGSPPTQTHLHFLCRQHRIQVLVILEPMVVLDASFFCRRLGFASVLSNQSNKIWIFSSLDFLMVPIQDTDQLLHVRISSGLFPRPFELTAVYAKCTRMERRELWDSFKSLAESVGDAPWLAGGDFNCILHESERIGGLSDRRLDMEEFGDMVSDCGLTDAGFSGSPFTWERNGLKERLDMMFYSDQWLDMFPMISVSHLSRTWSDHAPMLITADAQLERLPSAFRFQSMWVRHTDFQRTVAQVWGFPCHETGMLRLQTKLRRLKQTLKWWNWNVFGDIFKKKQQAGQAVLEAEQIYDRDPNPLTRMILKKATAELNLILHMEEDFWRQKSACRWATDGERNTKFFHSLVKRRRCVNRIHSISQGNTVLTSPQDIRGSAVEFFQGLLSDDVLDLLPVNLNYCPHSQLDFTAVCALPTVEEIHTAVFGISRDSVSGPDGFSALFYQHCWDLIGTDVCEAVWDFFDGHQMPASFTATTIVLIPKVVFPSAWSDFWPISLCNVTNKIISKVLTSRLSTMLPDLLAPSQSGFVRGRLISDNILLAQEMVHEIGTQGCHPNLILKLDMAKAYDRIQWRFLFRVLELRGFPPPLLDMIRRCISLCGFSVLVNGQLSGFFQSTRGLRQGDPLWPTLFVLAADYLSRGLDILFDRFPTMQYNTRGGFSVSHLAYADDIMIFTTAYRQGLEHLRNFLEEYCQTSGQLVSAPKSTFIVSSRCPDRMISRIIRTLGYARQFLPVIYLGAPLYKGNIRGSLFLPLLDRINARISGWARTSLSFGGSISFDQEHTLFHGASFDSGSSAATVHDTED